MLQLYVLCDRDSCEKRLQQANLQSVVSTNVRHRRRSEEVKIVLSIMEWTTRWPGVTVKYLPTKNLPGER